MPNLYVTPAEVKDMIPDLMQAATTKYDDALMRICSDVSRFIDRWCKRVFYPMSETRYFDGNGETELWIDDVLSISELAYSDDDGSTYSTLAQSGNWHLTRAGKYDVTGSYDKLVIDPNGTTISVWPTGRKSVKITGIWGYADDRSDAWEDTGDTVQDNPLTSAATMLTVSDTSASGLFGLSPRLFAGQLLRIESEYLETTAISGTTSLTVIRGRNGTTAAQHAQSTQIDSWRPPDPIRDAAAIMVVRRHQRSLQGFADSRANADLGEMFWLRKIDPEAQELLMPYRLKEVV